VDFGGRGVERSQEAVLVAVVEVERLLEFAELLHGEFQDVAGPVPRPPARCRQGWAGGLTLKRG
jgi:hypothetical protein